MPVDAVFYFDPNPTPEFIAQCEAQWAGYTLLPPAAPTAPTATPCNAYGCVNGYWLGGLTPCNACRGQG